MVMRSYMLILFVIFLFSLKYMRHVSSVTFPVLLSPLTSLKINRGHSFFPRNSERRNWIFYDDGGFES